MTNVDQFESMFRSASREVFRHKSVDFESVLVVTDRDSENATLFGDQVRKFLSVISADEQVRWRDCSGSEFQSAGELLALIETAGPDLICTYRNLHSNAWKWPYSLGTHVDLLTQHTDVPVLLLPHPEAQRAADHALENTDTVMAIADHLTGDDRLVNFAVRMTESDGTLWLTHVEDEVTLGRYMEIISKIPTINTDEARDAVREQLLKEPQNFIDSCAEVLRTADVNIHIEHLVMFGHHLREYTGLIERHKVDLLVLNTKDQHQLAMHGMAYALAVELRQTPLLML